MLSSIVGSNSRLNRLSSVLSLELAPTGPTTGKLPKKSAKLLHGRSLMMWGGLWWILSIVQISSDLSAFPASLFSRMLVPHITQIHPPHPRDTQQKQNKPTDNFSPPSREMPLFSEFQTRTKALNFVPVQIWVGLELADRGEEVWEWQGLS